MLVEEIKVREQQTIENTTVFQSKQTLIEHIRGLGIEAGDSIIVHSSMRSLGWVAGGPQSVVEALMEVVTAEGTIVMPAQSTDNSDPEYWMNPPVPQEWHEQIRQNIPAYDPQLTPLRAMGKIAETFLRHLAVVRSPHPSHSFMAFGKYAAEWMETHPIEDSFGERSPLGKMINNEVKIVLLGVDYDSCTALHLAEARQQHITSSRQGAAMSVDGKREWVEYAMLDADSERFPEIGAAFELIHPIKEGKVCQADVKILPMKELIEFGVEWLRQHPSSDGE